MSKNEGRNKDNGMDYHLRFRYETLRSLLNKNGKVQQIFSDLEADLNHIKHFDERLIRPVRRLVTESLLMAHDLNMLTNDAYVDLYQKIYDIRNETYKVFLKDQDVERLPLFIELDGGIYDQKLVGGKASNISLMSQYLGEKVPAGFVLTTEAYNLILKENNLHDKIRILLNNIDVTENEGQFNSRLKTIRNWICDAAVPGKIAEQIKKYSERYCNEDSGCNWAVRSSAVCEDGLHSFAGQFDSLLSVDNEGLVAAYLKVLASRFSERAVRYRLHNNLRDVDTPMAVLFMPMIDPAAAGVVYTSDISSPDKETVLINSVPHLADRMVKGEESADSFIISKTEQPEILKTSPATETGDLSYLSTAKAIEIASLAMKTARKMGHESDIEWVLDKFGKIHFIQVRTLSPVDKDNSSMTLSARNRKMMPVLNGGITIFPGRAEGPVRFVEKESDIAELPLGAVAVIRNPETRFAPMLSKIGALIVMEGNPIGHLATLVREFSVPCIFRVGQKAALLLKKRNLVSINATKRTVYSGVRWAGMRERVLDRIKSGRRHERSGPLYDYILKLNLIDPDDSSFKVKNCESIHDTVRFIHEMSVRSMFGLGDEQNRWWNKKSRDFKSEMPIDIKLFDLDKSIKTGKKLVKVSDVNSTPFKALWKGISETKMFWAERWEKRMLGLPTDFQEAVLGGNKGPRRKSGANYAIIANDYMNLNARFAYHYAMVDAMVGPGTENNYVHFRFRGGGAGDENRIRRARFIEIILRNAGFGVDRKWDLVTAWLRRYPEEDSSNAIEIIGKLMVCSSQLDAVLSTDESVQMYAEYFQQGRYDAFA